MVKFEKRGKEPQKRTDFVELLTILNNGNVKHFNAKLQFEATEEKGGKCDLLHFGGERQAV